jgi:hypothetical protein
MHESGENETIDECEGATEMREDEGLRRREGRKRGAGRGRSVLW